MQQVQQDHRVFQVMMERLGRLVLLDHKEILERPGPREQLALKESLDLLVTMVLRDRKEILAQRARRVLQAHKVFPDLRGQRARKVILV